MAQNLITDINVTSLAPSATIAIPHNLVSPTGVGLTPSQVCPNSDTPIAAISANATSVTFQNTGSTTESASFRAWRYHSEISPDSTPPFLWQGGSGGGGGAGGVFSLYDPASASSAAGATVVIPAGGTTGIQPYLAIPAASMQVGTQIRVSYQVTITAAGDNTKAIGTNIYWGPTALSAPGAGNFLGGQQGTGFNVNDIWTTDIVLTCRAKSATAAIWGYLSIAHGSGPSNVQSAGGLASNTVDTTVDQQLCIGLSFAAGVGNTARIDYALIQILN